MLDDPYQSFYEATVWNDLSTVQSILEQNPEVLNIGTSWGVTALMAATQSEHLDIMKYLLSQPGIAIDGVTQEGETAVHYAVRYRKNNALKLLISAGAKLDSCDIYDASPLWLAVCSNNTQATQILLAQEQIDINQKVACGHILTAACQYSDPQTIISLIDNPKLNLEGAASGSVSCLLKKHHPIRIDILEKLLLRADLDLSICDSNGHFPLTLALQKGLLSIAEKMLVHASLDLEKIWLGIIDN